MTTPTDPPADRPVDETAPLSEPAGASAERTAGPGPAEAAAGPTPAEAAAEPPPAGPGPYAAPYAAQYPPPYPPPYPAPFAPVMRQPWINPARRSHVLAAAVVGALLFGGGGVLVGHALTDNHDQGNTMMPFENGRGHGPGMGQFPGRGPLQNGPGKQRGRATETPQPSPTKTS